MGSREIHNLIIIGTIDTISEGGTSARVRVGDILTKFLPLPAFYSQNLTGWFPAHEQAQVILNCPSGNVDAAVIIGWLWPRQEGPYRNDRHIDGIRFNDGTTVEYNSQSGKLLIDAKGDVEIKAAGTLSLTAELIEISGPVTQTGGDITSDGVSVQEHTHTETSVETKKPS